MYRSAQAGQQIYLKMDNGDFKPIWFVAYYRTYKNLAQPNHAVVRFEPDGIEVNVEIKNLWKWHPYA